MNASEPTLFSHLNEARAGYFPEGGLSNVMLCGKFKADADVTAVMQAHRKVVEEEVNNESTNVTGILIVQVDFYRIILRIVHCPIYNQSFSVTIILNGIQVKTWLHHCIQRE